MSEPTIQVIVQSDPDYPVLVDAIRKGLTLRAVAYAREMKRRHDIPASIIHDIAKKDAWQNEPPLRYAECIYRTARKAWVCKCDCHRPDVDDPDGKLQGHAEICVGKIKPGDRYIEYIGEVGRYGESGTRYCLPCGVAEWKVES